MIIGDPHYRTFDGAMIHVQHGCKSEMVESVAPELPYFRVLSRHEHRNGNTNVSYPMYLEVITNDHEFRLGKDNTVTVRIALLHNEGITGSEQSVYIVTYKSLRDTA